MGKDGKNNRQAVSLSNQDSLNQQSFWSLPASELLEQLKTTPKGLTDEEAGKRLTKYGANLLKPKKRSNALTLLLTQFKSPLILILIFAAGLSFSIPPGDPVNASIILAIILISSLLGFWQERGAANAIEKLIAIVETKAKNFDEKLLCSP